MEYKLVAAMQDPLVIPRTLIERFLEKSIPDAGAMLSWMRTEKPGDSLSPKLRQVLANLKVSGWANLYLDPRNEIKAKLLMLMPPDEINALAAELGAMSVAEQQNELIELIKTATQDDEDDEIEPLTREEFEALPDAERMKVVGDLQRFFGFCMPMLLNYLALMVHRKSLYQLVAEAVRGDDDSFLKAIQIDKTVLTTIPYFIERNCRAADEGNFAFQRQINTYRNKPIFVSRTRYPLRGGSVVSKRRPIWGSESPSLPSRGFHSFKSGDAASMTGLTSMPGWTNISAEGGPERRIYGP